MKIGNNEIITEGKFIKIGKIKSEWYKDFGDPNIIIEHIKNNKCEFDIFTFMERFKETQPKYDYYMEWDNVAAIPVTTYDYWWKTQIKDKTRNMVRKAEKNGVVTKVVEFSDELVKGITNIYNETPIRQGRPFWHYGKSFDVVKKDNSSYLDRSDFIAAYFDDVLIGFIKIIYDKDFATIMQIISLIEHRDKAVTNALIAKSVELCAERGLSKLVYSTFIYGKKGVDSLANFKRHNAFEKIDLPRYYIPLTLKGKIALNLKIHRGILEIFPESIVRTLLNWRNRWNYRKYKM